MSKPTKLQYVEVHGAGKQIIGTFEEEFDCVEFSKLPGPHMIATEPWMQFAPTAWQDMVGTLFEEMVVAWNEKHATDDGTTSE